MPLAVTIDGLPSSIRPPVVDRVLGMVRWSAASGLRDVSSEVADAVDDRLWLVKAAALAGATLAALTLIVVVATRPVAPSRRRGR